MKIVFIIFIIIVNFARIFRLYGLNLLHCNTWMYHIDAMTQKQLHDTIVSSKLSYNSGWSTVFFLLTPALKRYEYINTMEPADTN